MLINGKWTKINADTFNNKLSKAYAEYQEANEETKSRRATFEGLLTAALSTHTPAGTQPRFSYKWGQLAVLFDKPKLKAAAKDMIQLG